IIRTLSTAGQQALLQAMSFDTPAKSSAARELLAFYQEAGVDALVGETPLDRLAGEPARETVQENVKVPSAPVRPQPAPAAPPRSPRRPFSPRDLDPGGRVGPPPSPDAGVMAARDAAKTAASLEELRAILERFEGCALRNTASRLVFADGNPQ